MRKKDKQELLELVELLLEKAKEYQRTEDKMAILRENIAVLNCVTMAASDALGPLQHAIKLLDELQTEMDEG